VATDSGSAVASGARPDKRERLVAAARDLVHRQGLARTTLADIAQAADVPVGNVYYYFKTKDEIVQAVVRTHREQLTATLAELEHGRPGPAARLTAFAAMLAERAEATAQYGCPYGTLSAELARRAEGPDPLAAPLMQLLLDWAERQFRAMGRADAPDLAVEFVAAYQGGAVLSNALGRPELMAGVARRLQRWIEALPG
jgi:AcrR family transcriptional regulator